METLNEGARGRIAAKRGIRSGRLESVARLKSRAWIEVKLTRQRSSINSRLRRTKTKPTVNDLDAIIPLSSLNQWAYCPRRCGLIHLEDEFEDNVHTARGKAEHERVDRNAHAIDDGTRVEYALPIWSHRLGMIGKCDVVEFWRDGTVYPVEYKHGARKRWLNDDLQLAAQAMCLEEMLGKPVPKGAIYHVSSRRRREVAITPELRDLVQTTAEAIRAMLTAKVLPPPLNDARCRECSLKDICQPEALVDPQRQDSLRQALFDPDAFTSPDCIVGRET